MNVSEILDFHRNECEFIRKLIDEALQYRNTDFEKSKELMGFAKLFAETVAIVQAGERFNYGIDNAAVDLIRRAKEELKKRLAG